jgi:hypothetical protein
VIGVARGEPQREQLIAQRASNGHYFEAIRSTSYSLAELLVSKTAAIFVASASVSKDWA